MYGYMHLHVQDGIAGTEPMIGNLKANTTTTFLFHLQVLEYLAVREILTLEHINGGPRCLGVER